MKSLRGLQSYLSFSRDHSGFFFSSENERKLSSEVDALKADLDLLRAELETERQVHQKEEKTLRARVVETEKQRDAAVESAKNECKALRVEKQKLSESIDEMKALVRSSHNKAEEAQKTIENLTGKLATATENWNALWKSFRSVADVLWTSADDGQSWAQFIPRIPTRFQEFAKRCAQVCTKNVLAQVRVLAPEAPLSKIAEEADSQEYLDAVERMEPEVEDLASRVVDSVSIDISLSDDNA
ncbi:uncharacterized protein [Miscanthus floridulus]|uniref:uncharacterized protein n=1 Tax=Miscanthus floridulus TaxID=154761 RepID=UPI003458F6E8